MCKVWENFGYKSECHRDHQFYLFPNISGRHSFLFINFEGVCVTDINEYIEI